MFCSLSLLIHNLHIAERPKQERWLDLEPLGCVPANFPAANSHGQVVPTEWSGLHPSKFSASDFPKRTALRRTG